MTICDEAKPIRQTPEDGSAQLITFSIHKDTEAYRDSLSPLAFYFLDFGFKSPDSTRITASDGLSQCGQPRTPTLLSPGEPDGNHHDRTLIIIFITNEAQNSGPTSNSLLSSWSELVLGP